MQGIGPLLKSTTGLWLCANRELQELVHRPDAVEAELAVEPLRPVARVGLEEHGFEAARGGRVGSRQHRRSGVAATAPLLQRADLVDLPQPAIRVETARAGRAVGRRGEVAATDDSRVALVHLGELADGLVLPAERLLAPEGGERRGALVARHLGRPAGLRAVVGRAPADHDEQTEDVPARRGELGGEAGAELLVVRHELAMAELALDLLGLRLELRRAGAGVVHVEGVQLPDQRQARRQHRDAVVGAARLVAHALSRVSEECSDDADHSMPSRSRRPSSRRQPRRTRTRRSRCTRPPVSRSISLRAEVPTAFTIRPPRPTRIPFCDSVSAHTRARTTRRPSSRRSSSSISTSTACGSSSRVRSRTCSRISSASRTASGRSLVASDGYRNGPSGSSWTRCWTSSATPAPERALTGNTSPSTPSSAAASSARAVRGRSKRSTLFTAVTAGSPTFRSARAMKRSPAPTCCSPFTRNSAASASPSARSTCCCIRSVSTSRGRCTPGRSTRTSCQSSPDATPRISRRVVWGLSDTIATLPPTIRFTSVDLPTFGRPAMATKPERVTGRGAPEPAGRAYPRGRSRGRKI